MTLRRWTILAILIAAVTFGGAVELPRLFVAFQPMTVALSIMVAGVLVRLNRGMPTLDWKSLEPEGRRKLTSQIVILSKEYLSILGINAGLAIVLVAFLVIGKPAVMTWPDIVSRVVSGLIGGATALAIARMGYVVWRDYDIVKLQKLLIDASGDKEFQEKQDEAAAEKVEHMKSASLRRVEPPSLKDWH